VVPRRSWVLIFLCLGVALAIDWFVAAWSYPIAALYGVALLVAAHSLAPRHVAAVTLLAGALSIGSNILQATQDARP
jgi:uncharacterized membrane protein